MRLLHLAAPAALALAGVVGCRSRVNGESTPVAARECAGSTPQECQRLAARTLAVEMARVGKTCNRARTQAEENVCLARAADTTNLNLERFLGALETIVGRDAVVPAENAWVQYRAKQCEAVFQLFRPGTIAGAAQARCEIELARSRMRDLDAIFETSLHH